MNRKEKPVLAQTKTRAIKTIQANDNPLVDKFQCPHYAFSGNAELFHLSWPDLCYELIIKNSGLGFDTDLHSMSWQELFVLYMRLCKHGCKIQ